MSTTMYAVVCDGKVYAMTPGTSDLDAACRIAVMMHGGDSAVRIVLDGEGPDQFQSVRDGLPRGEPFTVESLDSRAR